MSAGETSSKASLSTLTYRLKTLRPAGIYIDANAWDEAPEAVRQLVEVMLNFNRTIAPDTRLARISASIGQEMLIATSEPDVSAARAILAKANDLAIGAHARMDRPEAKWTKTIESALESLLSDTSFEHMQDALWNAVPNPLRAADRAPTPKPDFAVGFRLEPAPRRVVPRRPVAPSACDDPVPVGDVQDQFDMEFVQSLVEKPGIYLTPWVNKTHLDLIYPFFCIEAKSSIGSTYAAANQLAGSLSFALGLLWQLREMAQGEGASPLIAFGCASAGRLWEVYVAYEKDVAAAELQVCLCRIWMGALDSIGDCVKFLHLVQKIGLWAKVTLRAQIKQWLDVLAEVDRLTPPAREA